MNNFIPIVTLIGIFATFVMSLINYWHNKRKDLEEKLYDVKVEAYRQLSNTAFILIEKLRIQGYPFSEIKKPYHANEMEEYFNKEYHTMENTISESKKIGQHYMVFLPNGALNNYFHFISSCEIYVIKGQDFNYDLLYDLKSRCLMDYYKMIDFFRNDLGIDKLDESLKKRLKSL